MSRTRAILTYVVAFLTAQALAILVHGVLLAKDYGPLYGTMLRPMQGAPQAPMYLIWYAEQPWPFALVVKQLAYGLASMLILGIVVAAMCRPSGRPAAA